MNQPHRHTDARMGESPHGVGATSQLGDHQSVLEVARHLAIRIERLPAVATLDWCDLAAECISAEIGGTVCVVMIGSVSETGEVDQVEAVGVATGDAGPASSLRSATTPEILQSIRTEVEQLRRVPIERGNSPAVSLSALLGDTWRESACAMVFGAAVPNDVAVCIHGVADAPRGRSVVILLACVGDCDPISKPQFSPYRLEQLWSATAHIAERAAIAIGPERSTRGRWISEREREVLDHLVLGESVREIALSVGRSAHTIHDHVKSLHKKLGASSRGELVARALGYSACPGGKSTAPTEASQAEMPGVSIDARGAIPLAAAYVEVSTGDTSDAARRRATPLPIDDDSRAGRNSAH